MKYYLTSELFLQLYHMSILFQTLPPPPPKKKSVTKVTNKQKFPILLISNQQTYCAQSSILAGEFLGPYSPRSCKESDMTEQLSLPLHFNVLSKHRPIVLSRSSVRLFVTPWTAASQAPLSMRILQARTLEWVAIPLSKGSSQPRDQTQVSHTAGGFYTV